MPEDAIEAAGAMLKERLASPPTTRPRESDGGSAALATLPGRSTDTLVAPDEAQARLS